MAVANPHPAGFSADGEYFSHAMPDGTFKIWETASSRLLQEYTPSSHLSSTCTCLSWSPKRRTCVKSPKRKKHKGDQLETQADAIDLIALGTTSGAVLLYSFIKGDLHTQLKNGHTGRVNDVCWKNSTNMYSCSGDTTIVHWNVKKAIVQHKWKAGPNSVYSICMCSSGNHLLSASRKIRLWDLDTHTCLKKFSGHLTEVFRLRHIPLVDTGQDSAGTVQNSYFISAAVGDRVINAWQIDETKAKEKAAVASFTLPEEPVFLDFLAPTESQQALIMTVVTISGKLLIFEHVLNGMLKKPLKPKVELQIATDGKVSKTKPIPVLGAQIRQQQKTSLHIAHGTFLHPVFEKLLYKKLSPEMCLVRKDPTESVISLEKSVSTVKTPGVSKDLTVLAPEMLAPAKPSHSERKAERKRRKSQSEMTMEERLNVISIDKSVAEKSKPSADSLATLLAQGLQSSDRLIINQVLSNTDTTIIRNTIRRLPVPVIVPLVKYLTVRMQSHAQAGDNLIKWVKHLLTLHTSYLMTFPELVEALGSLYQMIDTRVSIFERLSRLQGKLDLIMSQVASQGTESEEEVNDSHAPLLAYQDDSDSDDYGMQDVLSEQDSDSATDWEVSDMEVGADKSSSDDEPIEVDEDSDEG